MFTRVCLNRVTDFILGSDCLVYTSNSSSMHLELSPVVFRLSAVAPCYEEGGTGNSKHGNTAENNSADCGCGKVFLAFLSWRNSWKLKQSGNLVNIWSSTVVTKLHANVIFFQYLVFDLICIIVVRGWAFPYGTHAIQILNIIIIIIIIIIIVKYW